MDNHSLGLRIVSALLITGVSVFAGSGLDASASEPDVDAERQFQTTLQSSDSNSLSAPDEAYAQAMWEYINTHG